MARRSSCVNAKAHVRVGRKYGRCHLGKNGRIYCCTSNAPKRKSSSRRASVHRGHSLAPISYGRGESKLFNSRSFNTPPSAFAPYRAGSPRAYSGPKLTYKPPRNKKVGARSKKSGRTYRFGYTAKVKL